MEIHKESEEFYPRGSEFFRRESEFFRQSCEITLPFGEVHSRKLWDSPLTARHENSGKLLRSYFFIAAVVLVLYSANPFGGEEMPPWVRAVYNRNQPEYYVEYVPYTVKAGDTLWDIAKIHMGNGLGYHAIAEQNHLENPDLIFPGDRLILPIVHRMDE